MVSGYFSVTLTETFKTKLIMSTLEVWLIILLVVGVIMSNLAVLKYSAKFKMPQFKADSDKDKTQEKDNNTPDS